MDSFDVLCHKPLWDVRNISQIHLWQKSLKLLFLPSLVKWTLLFLLLLFSCWTNDMLILCCVYSMFDAFNLFFVPSFPAFPKLRDFQSKIYLHGMCLWSAWVNLVFFTRRKQTMRKKGHTEYGREGDTGYFKTKDRANKSLPEKLFGRETQFCLWQKLSKSVIGCRMLFVFVVSCSLIYIACLRYFMAGRYSTVSIMGFCFFVLRTRVELEVNELNSQVYLMLRE